MLLRRHATHPPQSGHPGGFQKINMSDRKTAKIIWIISAVFAAVLAAGVILSVVIAHAEKKELTEQAREAFSQVTVTDIRVIAGSRVSPEDFVANGKPDTVGVSFVTEPSTKEAGEFTVPLRLTYGNEAETRTVRLTVCTYNRTVKVSVGSTEAVTVSDYIPTPGFAAEFVGFDPDSIDRSNPGIYDGKLLINNHLYEITFEVADTEPPRAVPVEGTVVLIGKSVKPADLVTDVSDVSTVDFSFAEEPDFSAEGDVTVKVRLTDTYGNSSVYEVTVTVAADTEPPVFSGLHDITITVGDTISYKSGVTVSDNSGEDIEFTVDASAVNRNKAGTYKVKYTAADSSGNTAEEYRTVIVIKLSIEKVERMIADLAKKIVNDGMTNDEKIKKIWNYTRLKIKYTGRSTKSDVYTAAYEGMTTGGGDCYTYYAMNTLLFRHLGIENTEVRRVEGKSRHWWSLVLFDDGKWYFVDSCPLPTPISGNYAKTGKMTKTVLRQLTELENKYSGTGGTFFGYYEYDESLYTGYDIAE